jgi:hypothetical protein
MPPLAGRRRVRTLSSCSAYTRMIWLATSSRRRRGTSCPSLLHIPQKSSSMGRPPNRQLHAALLTPFCQLLRCKGYKGAYPTQNVSMRPRPRDSTLGGKATYIQAALDRGLSCRQFRKVSSNSDGFAAKTTGRPKSGTQRSLHDLAHAPAVSLCSSRKFAPPPVRVIIESS